jgi:hypothetical protein
MFFGELYGPENFIKATVCFINFWQFVSGSFSRKLDGEMRRDERVI